MTQKTNAYLGAPIGVTFFKTALPIMLIMVVNGLFNIVDAYFLGQYAGRDALIAVTLVFPAVILIIALSTLVSNGFSSIYARTIGAGADGSAVLSSAISTALVICGIILLGFLIVGRPLSLWIAHGSTSLARMGHLYLLVMVCGAPIAFLLSLGLDAFRALGRIRLMTAITLSSALLNIGFDALFVVVLEWGVFGSAFGTVLAQICALSVILLTWREARPALIRKRGAQHWRSILSLGLPPSLGYVGLSLSSAATLFMLQIWQADNYDTYSGAFGILTRLMTFMFLPLLGLSMGYQTMISTNFGAGLHHRVKRINAIGILTALIYTGSAQILFWVSAPQIGTLFVDDPAITHALAHILRINTMSLFLFGPLMMIGTYFIAIGDAPRAGILMLSRTYLFAIPLTFLLPMVIGADGIWLAGVVAEVFVLIVTIFVLTRYRPNQIDPHIVSISA